MTETKQMLLSEHNSSSINQLKILAIQEKLNVEKLNISNVPT